MSYEVRRATLETLIERQQLHDLLITCWCTGVDTVNWKLYRAVLADEVEMDFPGPSSVNASLPVVWKSDDWIGFARQIEGFDSSQHCVSNFIYGFSGRLPFPER